jgi:hypothetical protein
MTLPTPHSMPPDIAASSKHAIVNPSFYVIEQALNEIDFCDWGILLRDPSVLYTTTKAEGDVSSNITLFLSSHMYQQVRVTR